MESKKILIVEDNENNLQLFKIILRKLGPEILVAKNGPDAFELIKSRHPDLIMMDIQIPGMSGIDVIKETRKLPDFAETPIIAVTAYAMSGDKEKILAAGADYYLSKPVNTRELPLKVKEILEGHENLEES